MSRPWCATNVVATTTNRDSHMQRYAVTGPLGLLLRLYYGPKVRRAMPATFAALEAEATRRG